MKKQLHLISNPDERQGRRRQISNVHASDDNLSDNSDPDDIVFKVNPGSSDSKSKSGKQRANETTGNGQFSANTQIEETEAIKVNLNEAEETKSLNTGGKDLERTERVCCAPIKRLSNLIWGKCTMHRGCLKGKRQSIPRKQHIIHFWRKQLHRRIQRKKLAIIVDGSSDLKVSYQELDEFSNSIANNLMRLKFNDGFENMNPDGDLVIAVCLPSCYEYIVLLVAILKLGATFLPLSSDFPAERIADIITLTRPILTIVSVQEEDIFMDVAKLVEFESITVDEIWLSLTSELSITKAFLPVKNPIKSPDKSKPSPPMWKRTVGITVIPSEAEELQIVRYNSTSFLNRYAWEKHYFPYLNSEECIMAPNSDSMDFVADLLTQLCIGVTIVALPNPLDYYIPDILFMTCSVYNVKRLTVFPDLLKGCAISMQLFEEHSQCVDSIRYWFCIGGLMTSEIAEMFFESAPHIARLIHMYQHDVCLGPLTFQVFETVKSATSSDYFARLPVGTAIPNNSIYILDENLRPVPDGENGQIYIAGLQTPIILPYVKEAPNEYYVKNPNSWSNDRKMMIRTFDYGRIVRKPDGYRILIHDITRSRHYHIENRVVWLVHIDMYLQRLPNLVKEFHTMCYRPNQDDQVILVFCVMVNSKITWREVEDELCNCLPSSMVPEVVPVTEIPRLSDNETPDENQLLDLYRKRRIQNQSYDNWNALHLPPHKLHAAQVLSYVLNTFTGVPIKELVTSQWDQPYLAIRRATMTKGVFIVKELHKNRYPLYMDDFMYAPSMNQIVEEMVVARKERASSNRDCPADEVVFLKNRYKLLLMANTVRSAVCGLLAKCFTARGQLDYYAQVSHNSMRKFFDVTWPIFATKKLSIIVRRKERNNLLVGAVLCMSWHDELHLKTQVPTNIGYKLELIEYLESGLTDTHFHQENANVLQICYIGLDHSVLTNAEVHGLTDKIIRSILIIAKVKEFDTVVIVTYDYFIRDICIHNYNFHVAKECQVNQFAASDGTNPYALCPDYMISSILWKGLSKDIPQHVKLYGLPSMLKAAEDAKQKKK